MNLADLDRDQLEGEFINWPEVARQKLEECGPFHVRYIEGPRTFLNWQVGLVQPEWRRLPMRNNMPDGFNQTIVLFHLLGYGATRDKAIAMAEKKHGGRA